MFDFKRTLIKLLSKYYFILKAAADGWRVFYIGGDQFTFTRPLGEKRVLDSDTFIQNYRCSLFDYW
jgi:hypothetical protein